MVLLESYNRGGHDEPSLDKYDQRKGWGEQQSLWNALRSQIFRSLVIFVGL